MSVAGMTRGVFLAALLAGAGSAMAGSEAKPGSTGSLEDVQARLAKYAPTEMAFDARKLPEKDRQLLKHLLAASAQIDEIFWRQSYSKAAAIRDSLKAKSDPLSKALYHLVMINAGPFDRLEEGEPFYGKEKLPPGAGYYPPDLTRKELEDYVKAHPDRREALLSPTTVIKRQGKDGRRAVPPGIRALDWPRRQDTRRRLRRCRTTNPSSASSSPRRKRCATTTTSRPIATGSI